MERIGDILRQDRIQTGTSRGNTGTSSSEGLTEETAGHPVCEICEGVGWVTPDVPFGHPEFGKATPCTCMKAEWEERIPERLEQYSNLGPLSRLTFDNVIPQGRSPDEDNRRLFQTAYEATRPRSMLITPEAGWCLIGNEWQWEDPSSGSCSQSLHWSKRSGLSSWWFRTC